MDWLMVAAGLVLLVFAGDALVKGAVNLALRLGIPALIVSLTVVAFGTSAPELLVSVDAILKGTPGLALGNVVGSNVANVLLVLGIPALITTLHASGGADTRSSFLQMMGATVLFMALAFTGVFSWGAGLLLLAALAAMLIYAARVAHRHRNGNGHGTDDEEVEGADPKMRGWKVAAYLLAGVIGLPVGADLLVTGAVSIAETFGVSDTAIGLTLVAIGTSLPELATTVMAAIRREADVAMGNVIGSNMFNLLGILGVASLVGPIPVGADFLGFDLWVMLAASLLLVPFVYWGRDVTRGWGVALTALYVGYGVTVLA
ncbi:calcium/sodium antiporter [Limimaricola hongkongensis]|uniref:K+-dependent Na+/Ca+ exchanger related-protein n=1 Tax=Limimaricola hongkongensis DSM 17492 TaxID=1122180 RepID=A0A017HE71_9RHOB|nr:calcium/sodium antiporter [Limimaricola hongkongensis]EYD72059.1 K+-dependent Na+/Ca+ exchanger related-protein [Limimaricola hongkongensis DSM 17492]